MKNSGRFVYEEISDEIRKRIDSGQYRSGEKIPSEVVLAEEFGCSFHTVRKALLKLVKEAWLDRRVGLGSFVLDRAVRKEAGAEQAKPYAKGLAMLIQPDPGMFTMSAIDALFQEADRRRIFLNIRPVKRFDRAALDAVAQLKRQGCVAVVIPRFDTDAGGELGEFVKASPLPVVTPEVLSGLEKNCYYRNEYSGEIDYAMTTLAFKYFTSLGYSAIAFFGPDKKYDMPLQRKLAAYSSMVSRFGLQPFICLAEDSFADVDAAVEQWRQNDGKMAVICYDDNFAIRLMTALHKNGLRIPEDFAVIGTNDSPECESADPPLSSIAFPFDLMARGMISHAMAMASGGSDKIETIGTGELKIRKSSVRLTAE